MACKESRHLHSHRGGQGGAESPPLSRSHSGSQVSWMWFHRGVCGDLVFSSLPRSERVCTLWGTPGGGVPPPGLLGGGRRQSQGTAWLSYAFREAGTGAWAHRLSHSRGSSYSDTGHHPFQDGQSSSPIYRGEREAHGVGWGYCRQSHRPPTPGISPRSLG